MSPAMQRDATCHLVRLGEQDAVAQLRDLSLPRATQRPRFGEPSLQAEHPGGARCTSGQLRGPSSLVLRSAAATSSAGIGPNTAAATRGRMRQCRDRPATGWSVSPAPPAPERSPPRPARSRRGPRQPPAPPAGLLRHHPAPQLVSQLLRRPRVTRTARLIAWSSARQQADPRPGGGPLIVERPRLPRGPRSAGSRLGHRRPRRRSSSPTWRDQETPFGTVGQEVDGSLDRVDGGGDVGSSLGSPCRPGRAGFRLAAASSDAAASAARARSGSGRPAPGGRR